MIKIEVLNYLENLKNNQYGEFSIQIKDRFQNILKSQNNLIKYTTKFQNIQNIKKNTGIANR